MDCMKRLKRLILLKRYISSHSKYMKIILSIIALSIIHAASAQNTPAYNTVSEDSLNGKTYKAEITTLYARTVGGGVRDTRYCCLSFEKDSVKITHVQLRISYSDGKKTESHTAGSKTYPWRMHNAEIIIENFKDYGHLNFRNNQIVGKNWSGYDLIFSIENDQPVKLQNE